MEIGRVDKLPTFSLELDKEWVDEEAAEGNPVEIEEGGWG